MQDNRKGAHWRDEKGEVDRLESAAKSPDSVCVFRSQGKMYHQGRKSKDVQKKEILMQKIVLVIEGRPQSKDNEKFWNPHVGRPFTSTKFKKYEADVKAQAQRQMDANGWTMFTVPVFCIMKYYFKNNVRLDIFNSPKSISDALNKTVWTDDKLVERAYLEIMGNTPRERCEIEVWPLDDGQIDFMKG